MTDAELAELDAAILANAQSPKKAAGDMGSMEQHPLQDQLEVRKQGARSSGVAKAHRGIYRTKLIPPSGTGS